MFREPEINLEDYIDQEVLELSTGIYRNNEVGKIPIRNGKFCKYRHFYVF